MTFRPIAEQVLVLFGASSGIGRQTALQFARRGARVVVAGRGEAELAALVEEISREGGTALSVPAEATEFEQVESVAAQAVAAYGRLDTWVHLAGVGLWAPFEQVTPAEWRRVIDVNLNGAAYGAMAALPHLKRGGGGTLILVSSAEARLALPLQTAYAASKHGVDGFVKSLRLELRHEGAPVRVTEVMPAAINTPLFNKARTRIGKKPVPIRPFYQPELVADAIRYAAEHPVEEITVGGAAKAAMRLHQLAPWLTNRFLATAGIPLQRTEEPKSDQAPDNLFQHLDGYARVHGDFSDEARRASFYTWLALHTGMRRVLIGAAVAAAALLAARARRDLPEAPRDR